MAGSDTCMLSRGYISLGQTLSCLFTSYFFRFLHLFRVNTVLAFNDVLPLNEYR